MAGICYGVVGEAESSSVAAKTVETTSSLPSRRRRLETLPLQLAVDVAIPPLDLPSQGIKKQKIDHIPASNPSREDLDNVNGNKEEPLKYGVTSICGRRRDMEDAVSVHSSFGAKDASFIGVFDGHGCSHVAMKCRDRLHEIVKEEMLRVDDKSNEEWKELMEKSFIRMDKEIENCVSDGNMSYDCRCELQTPQCDAVGSTAVVSVVTPDKIVVSNCGDSRAVLCRDGVAIALSSDHKPDRPDETDRIEAAGGRVIYWDGPRVLGVLAMSRAIGDSYLKPFVIPDPEVTVMERTEEDECLILASDGLWDVVPNETACKVARMCLDAERSKSPRSGKGMSSDKACLDASILLTKLALARHSTDNVSVVVINLRRNSN